MLRPARREDVARIVTLLADDQLGAKRESADDVTPYYAGFDAIASDPNNELLVWDEGGPVVGCLQITFIPGLSHRSAWRMQIEAVRVARERRSQGIGEKMMGVVIAMARQRGCRTVQLTTDKSRKDAHRFYERLGFVASHEGMKLAL